MLPNSLASTGPSAGLWSHLKSMEHSLGRVLEGSGKPSKLDKLDQDRLRALIDFLRSGMAINADAGTPSPGLFALAPQPSQHYLPNVDVRAIILGVPEFEEWKRDKKKGVDDLLRRLVDAVQERLDAKELFTMSNPQREEFKVLRAILQSLLSDAETDL